MHSSRCSTDIQVLGFEVLGEVTASPKPPDTGTDFIFV